MTTAEESDRIVSSSDRVRSSERESTYRSELVASPTSSSSSPVKIRSQDSNANVINFIKDDKPSEMTRGRRIALALMNYSWYNPQAAPKEEEGDPSANGNNGDAGKSGSDEGDGGYYDAGTASATKPDAAVDDVDEERTTTEPPSLAKAWAYFEHVALSRYIAREDPNKKVKKNIFIRIIRKYSKANKKLERAEPGENQIPTKLYDPIFTPHKQVRRKEKIMCTSLVRESQVRLTLSPISACFSHQNSFFPFCCCA